MENNQPQNLTKKFIIKRILIFLILVFAFTLPIIFISYGGIPVKAILISCALVAVAVTTGTILSLKYPNRMSVIYKITYPHRRLTWLLITPKTILILGILIIIVNLALILVKGGNSNYYMGVGLGLVFIYYSHIYNEKMARTLGESLSAEERIRKEENKKRRNFFNKGRNRKL